MKCLRRKGGQGHNLSYFGYGCLPPTIVGSVDQARDSPWQSLSLRKSVKFWLLAKVKQNTTGKILQPLFSIHIHT